MSSVLNVALGNAALALALAVAVAVVASLVRRPAMTHKLWLLVLLKLIAPPLLLVPLSWPSLPKTSPRFVGSGGGIAVPVTSTSVATLTRLVVGWWRPVVAGLWIAGSALGLVHASVRVIAFRRILRSACPATEEVQQRAYELTRCLGIARVPGVWMVPSTVPPLTWALGGSPRLLLPAAFWERCSEVERDAILVHELAHLRRRDHWVRVIELVATVVYWWHPAAWWARRALREAEEQCCDAWVLWALPEAGRTYAQTLLAVVDFLADGAPALSAAVSGVSQFRHLHARIGQILTRRAPRCLSRRGVLGLACMAIALLPLSVAGRRTGRTLDEIEALAAQADAKRAELSELEGRLALALRDRGESAWGPGDRVRRDVFAFRTFPGPSLGRRFTLPAPRPHEPAGVTMYVTLPLPLVPPLGTESGPKAKRRAELEKRIAALLGEFEDLCPPGVVSGKQPDMLYIQSLGKPVQ